MWKQLALFVNIMQLHCDKYILQSIGLYTPTEQQLQWLSSTWHMISLRDRSFNFLFHCTQCNQSWDYGIEMENRCPFPLHTYIHYVHHLNSHKTCTFPRTQSCDWSSLWDQTESLRRTYVYTTHCQLHPLHLATAQHCALIHSWFQAACPIMEKQNPNWPSTKCHWVWQIWLVSLVLCFSAMGQETRNQLHH